MPDFATRAKMGSKRGRRTRPKGDFDSKAFGDRYLKGLKLVERKMSEKKKARRTFLVHWSLYFFVSSNL